MVHCVNSIKAGQVATKCEVDKVGAIKQQMSFW